MNGSFFVCHSHIVHINCFFVLRNAIYQIVYIEGLKNSEGFEAFIYVPPVDSPQRYRYSCDRSGSSKNATLPQNVDVECCY